MWVRRGSSSGYTTAIASLRISASAPAVSTPVAPPPTTTMVSSGDPMNSPEAAACSSWVKILSRSASASARE